jgi:recombination protein RecR
MLSPLTQNLIHALSSLSGIGPKSAQRICFQLLKNENKTKALRLAAVLQEAIEKIAMCQQCHYFAETPLCAICSSEKRNQLQICVLESPGDVVALEQSYVYAGRYFILHGHLSPIDGIGAKDLKIPSLIEQVVTQDIEEVIIATSATMEGEATAYYIAEQLRPLNVKCSRIAHGVPIGGELEYLDGNTLAHALKSRRQIYEPQRIKAGEQDNE